MRDYINNYEAIRSTFVMDDRDEHEFSPESATFIKDALEYALRRSFRDFNFRTLTAVKSNKKTGFVCEYDKWAEQQRSAMKNAKNKIEKDAISVGRTDYLIEKLNNSIMEVRL